MNTALDGWPIELADTAGLREATDPIEAEGIARSRREQAEADLILVVLDRSEPLQSFDRELAASAVARSSSLNKSDLPAAWQPDDLRADAKPVVTISAERGDGISRAMRRDRSDLGSQRPSSQELLFRFGPGMWKLSSKLSCA